MTTPADLTAMTVRELLDAFGGVTKQYESDAIRAELERRCSPPADVREAAATILREWGHLPNGSIPSELVYPLARWVAGLGRTGGASP
jgi:hypothetical protein